MRDLTLFLAPNINSYKRYAEGSFAPTAVAWGRDNRTCSMRVIGHGPSLRMESRVAGGDVNPYLAIAAMIASGLHGIDNELELEPVFEGNAYTSDKPHVPTTLQEARDLFGASDVAQGGVRRGRRRALPQQRRRRAARVRGRRDGLGTRAGLRAAVTLTVLEPATEAVLAEIPRAGVEETDAAVARAKAAYPAWRAVAPGDRAALLHRLADALAGELEALAVLEARNAGKPIGDARGEMQMVVDTFRYYAAGPERNLGDTIPVAGGRRHDVPRAARRGRR